VPQTGLQTHASRMAEGEMLDRIRQGDARAFEALMRKCNQKLFRIARSILKDDSEAEDALQEAYLTAYTALKSFRGESALTTWLSRIVINEALGRMRKRRRAAEVIPIASGDPETLLAEEEAVSDERSTPEEAAQRSQLRAVLERKIDALPVAFRTVFVMRELEEMTVEETASALGIPEATVRTRLFRAKSQLRESLAAEIDVTLSDAFSFDGARCDRIVARVLARINP
jgi:RNA polymerase sigma-70 factor, ECF subfamily